MLVRESNNYKLSVKVENNTIVFYQEGNAQNKCSITLHRTLRIPDDGKIYPLPPSLGSFPICKVDDYLDKVPEEWKKTGGVFFPMYQREAMWMGFNADRRRPKALKIAVGKVNAINGKTWSNDLQPDDYVTIPAQPWLDGINAGGKGTIKQFVAMPLGSGYSVEAQVTGKEEFGGIQIMCVDANEVLRRQKFPDIVPTVTRARRANCDVLCASKSKKSLCSPASEMSLGSGGSMKQEISKDPHGIHFWDQQCFGRIYIRIVNSEMYQQITGKPAPPSPITLSTYNSHKYPWFNIYNENPSNSIDQSSTLNQVKSVKEIDQQKYAWPQQNDNSVYISNVTNIYKKSDVRDGDW